MTWYDSSLAPLCVCTAVYNQDDLADLQRQVSERKDKPGFQPILHNHMCFQASVWDRLNLHHVELIQVMRQSDAEFVQYLMDIRKGGAKCAVSEHQHACMY